MLTVPKILVIIGILQIKLYKTLHKKNLKTISLQ